jgi:hypothetical protein
MSQLGRQSDHQIFGDHRQAILHPTDKVSAKCLSVGKLTPFRMFAYQRGTDPIEQKALLCFEVVSPEGEELGSTLLRLGTM